ALLVWQAERLVLEKVTLPAVLKGEHRPQDNAERLALLSVCRGKRLYHAAARLSADAFAADPALADDLKAGHRYRAARAAARAAAGEGGAALSPEERTRWRRQAVAWLRADLALWARHLDDEARKALR